MATEIVYVEKKSNVGLIIFGAILLLGGLFGLAWYINRKAPALSSDTDAAQEPVILNTSVPATNPETVIGGALTQMVNLVSPPASPSSSSLFPLERQFGANLHIVNPLVKDVQQYLNKFAGKNLDVDGAFGAATEAAVLQVLKTKTVSMAQYNTMAKALGKPEIT